MAGRDEVQSVAAALKRPQRGYVGRLEAVRDAVAPRFGEVGRQLGLFLDRIGDLSTEELRELHDETFGRTAGEAIGRAVHGLADRPTLDSEASAALELLAPLLDRLEADRNPFAHAVKALCCLLITRVTHSHMEHSTQ